MSVHVLVLSYSRMTNLSMVCKISSCMSLCAYDNVNSASVSCGSAVFLACPTKLDTCHNLCESIKHWKFLSLFCKPNAYFVGCSVLKMFATTKCKPEFIFWV